MSSRSHWFGGIHFSHAHNKFVFLSSCLYACGKTLPPLPWREENGFYCHILTDDRPFLHTMLWLCAQPSFSYGMVLWSIFLHTVPWNSTQSTCVLCYGNMLSLPTHHAAVLCSVFLESSQSHHMGLQCIYSLENEN